MKPEKEIKKAFDGVKLGSKEEVLGSVIGYTEKSEDKRFFPYRKVLAFGVCVVVLAVILAVGLPLLRLGENGKPKIVLADSPLLVNVYAETDFGEVHRTEMKPNNVLNVKSGSEDRVGIQFELIYTGCVIETETDGGVLLVKEGEEVREVGQTCRFETKGELSWAPTDGDGHCIRVVIRENENVVGLALIRIWKAESGAYFASLEKSVGIPLVDGKHQKIDETYLEAFFGNEKREISEVSTKESSESPEILDGFAVPDKISLRKDGSTLELAASYDRNAFPSTFGAVVRNGELCCYCKENIVYDAKTGEILVKPNELHDGFERLTEMNGVYWFLYTDGVVASYNPETKEAKTYPGVSEHVIVPEEYSYYGNASYEKNFLIRKDREQPLVVTYLVLSFFGTGNYYTVDGEQVDIGDSFTPGEDETAVLGGNKVEFERQEEVLLSAGRDQTGQVRVENYMYWFIGTTPEREEGLLGAALSTIYDENGNFKGNFYYEYLDYSGVANPSGSTTFCFGDKQYDRGKDVLLLQIGDKVFENYAACPPILYDEAGNPYTLISNGEKWELYRIHMTKNGTDVAARIDEVYRIRK